MTPEEFEKEYCSLCGSQRCGGITDIEFRDGCQHYTKEYLAIRDMIETTWPQWKIDWYNNHMATAAHAIKLQHKVRNPSIAICPKCKAIAEYNAYYGRVTCTRCAWEGNIKD